MLFSPSNETGLAGCFHIAFACKSMLFDIDKLAFKGFTRAENVIFSRLGRSYAD